MSNFDQGGPPNITHKLHDPDRPWRSMLEYGPPVADNRCEVMENGQNIQVAFWSSSVGWIALGADDKEITVTHWRYLPGRSQK